MVTADAARAALRRRRARGGTALADRRGADRFVATTAAFLE
ncbi:hypothetical protein [Streptomyces humicola]|nr:hypothetical protein [Streptomyces humicola]